MSRDMRRDYSRRNENRDYSNRDKAGRETGGRDYSGRGGSGRDSGGRNYPKRNTQASMAGYELGTRQSEERRGAGVRRSEEHRGTDARQSEERRDTRIEGRNPVFEALHSGRTIDKLYVLDRSDDSRLAAIKAEARDKGVPIKYLSRSLLDEMSETGKHQGVIADVTSYSYAQVEDIVDRVQRAGETPFIIFLDGVTDPHNLGAIIRTAAVAGAQGVVIPKDRAVGLTATVAKAAAGALETVPVARVTNMARTIETLKERGLWFVCADAAGKMMYNVDMTRPLGLVIGSEGSGVSRLVREKCDMMAAIPMNGALDSLNASVAAGILSYEVVRQRGQQ